MNAVCFADLLANRTTKHARNRLPALRVIIYFIESVQNLGDLVTADIYYGYHLLRIAFIKDRFSILSLIKAIRNKSRDCMLKKEEIYQKKAQLLFSA